jgi:hypothetical protein
MLGAHVACRGKRRAARPPLSHTVGTAGAKGRRGWNLVREWVRGCMIYRGWQF